MGLRRCKKCRKMQHPTPQGALIPAQTHAERGNTVSPEADVEVMVPVVGMMSVMGRLRVMEDTVCVQTALCRPDVCGRRPVHFFAVYDGHNGADVAALCRDRLHVLLVEELSRLNYANLAANIAGSSSSAPLPPPMRHLSSVEQEGLWRVVLARCFQNMDELALNTCASGSVGSVSQCHLNQSMLTGSTAAVVVLTEEHIIMANVGDSRVLLSRGGTAVPLSWDHKPDRPEERERILAAGRWIIHPDGVHVLATITLTRSLGDKYLKPVITAEPEITFTKRQPEDEFLILASDGLWDWMPNEMACNVARECLRDNSAPTVMPRPTAVGQADAPAGSMLYPSQSVTAAALLTRIALSRGSKDNISVIVVDLKRSELSS